MKLLLDTHISVNAVGSPKSLSLHLRRHLGRSNNQLFLSPISIWEADCLARRGRIQIKGTFSNWVREAFIQVPVQEAPLTFSVAIEAAGITLPQSDFGDVFLAATACVYDLTLVTEDPQLIECKWLKTLTSS